MKNKRIYVCCLLMFITACCFAKDMFEGTSWQGVIIFYKTHLKFGNDKTVQVVNLGLYEDEKGTYSYDEKTRIMTIKLTEWDGYNNLSDTLFFKYDDDYKILAFDDDELIVEYRQIKE